MGESWGSQLSVVRRSLSVVRRSSFVVRRSPELAVQRLKTRAIFVNPRRQ
jgi:hypothetical protein